MRLGTVAKQKVRHVVGVLRDLQAERLRVYEAAKEKREVRKKLLVMQASAERELAETQHAAARLHSTPESRTRDEQRCRQHVEEIAGRVAEVDAEIAKLEARHQALNADSRQAARVAEAVMARVDRDEQVLRDELDWSVTGLNTPPVLPGRV